MYRYWNEEEIKKFESNLIDKWKNEKRVSFSGKKEDDTPNLEN